MNDPTLIADLVRAGVDADLVGRVAAAIVRDTSRDNVFDHRDYERQRKREWRNKSRTSEQPAEANDAATRPQNVPAVSRTVPEKRCDLSFFLSSENGLSTKKEQEDQKAKKEPVERQARARGTRLQAGQSITDSDWQFARDQGLDAARIGAAWTEFVDYWIAVPGQRGTKLDWSATWRNRVRQLGTRSNGNGQQSDISAAKHRLVARAKDLEREAGFGEPEDATFPGFGGRR